MKFGLFLSISFAAGFLTAVPIVPPNPTNTATKINAINPGITTPGKIISSNADWLRHFQLKRGFYMEMVASDVLVTNPVAMAFDENGRLYVIERALPTFTNEMVHGRIRLLEDADGNGVFDSSVIFADNLDNPSALLCYDGGLFVAVEGQILFLRDSNGSGHADVRREAFKGFSGTGNGQPSVNGMLWDLDNRIHVATSGLGGNIVSSSSPAQSVVLTDGNFSFNPRTFLLAPETGNAKTGMTMDDRGRIFVSSPAKPVSMIVDNGNDFPSNTTEILPQSVIELQATNFAGLVYPMPNDPYQADTPLKPIFPFARGPVPFSAASSALVFRGTAYPSEYGGDIFIIDSAQGIIHHDKVRPSGLHAVLDRPADEQGYEFLSARNHSFLPTQIVNSPDGVIFLAGSLCSPVTVSSKGAKTNAVVANTPNLGRIYRILPDNFKQPVAPKLATANAERLVMMLRHPNGWYRDTATRLLYERQDKTAIAPLIRLLFDVQAPALARMSALLVLDGYRINLEGQSGRALIEAHLVHAMNDPDDRVREQGVRLTSQFISNQGQISDTLWSRLVSMGGDPSPQVRHQLAGLLAPIRRTGRASILVQLIRANPADRWIQSVILSSANGSAAEIFSALAPDEAFTVLDGSEAFLQQLLFMIGAKKDPTEVAQALQSIQNTSDLRVQFNLARALDNSLQRVDGSLWDMDRDGVLKPMYNRAENIAIDFNADDATRVAAMRLMSTGPLSYSGITVTLAGQWQGMRTALREEALRLLLSLPETKRNLLVEIQNGLIPRSDFSTAQVRMLLAERDPDLRQFALNLFTGYNQGTRATVVARYQYSLQMTGSAAQGRQIYLANCAACHTVTANATTLGISLTNAIALGKSNILVSIMDPNHAVSPSPATVIETARGERVLGFQIAQNPQCSRLITFTGVERDIGRSNIRFNDSLGVSIMPEGYETIFNQQNVADLVEYLVSLP